VKILSKFKTKEEGTRILLDFTKEDITMIRNAINTLWELYYNDNKSSSFDSEILTLLAMIVTGEEGQINDKIIIQLRDDYIPIEWDVVVAEDYSELEDKINKLGRSKRYSFGLEVSDED